MLRPSLILFFTSALLHAETCACTIPVFRYALDRWETDRFQLVVPASTSDNTVMTDLLRPLRANGKANLDITTAKDAAINIAELRDSKTGQQSLWSGLLDKATLGAVLDSPGRQQITERILAGESVVWVIVDSGKAEDEGKIARIQKRLKFLEQVAALPIQNPNDPDSQLGPGPALKLKFTTLRLKADDPAEKVLINMLAGPEGKVQPTSSFAAAVFGRGRVLGAWPLDQLDDASLEEACMFLVGRCSCRLKNENPGWDILLNVDWTKALAEADEKKVAVAEPKVVEMKQPETVVTKAQEPLGEVSKPTSSSEVKPSPVLMISGVLLLAVAAFLLLNYKR